jgi:tetratricopeptide (TPR) repeat protein
MSSFTPQQYVQQGAQALRQQRWNDAVTIYTQALQEDPTSVSAYANRAHAYSAQADYPRALDDMDQALALQPHWWVLYFNRGVIAGYMGERERAIADYTQAITFNPQEWVSYVNRASLLAVDNSLDAIRDLTEALRLHPRCIPAYLLRGQLYLQKSNEVQAFYDFDRATSLEPANADAQRLRRHALEQAEQRFAALLELGFDVAEIYTERGTFYWAQGRHDDALADFTQATEHAADNPRVWINRAGALLGLGQAEDALADINRALDLDATVAGIYSNRALIYLQLERPDDALADLDQAVALKPDQTDYRVLRARALRQQGDHEATLRALTEALTDRPDPAIYEAIGIIHLEQNQYVDAEVAWRRAVALAPTPQRAYHCGVSLMLQAKYIDALPYLNSAIQMQPAFAAAHLERGRALAECGQYDVAEMAYTQAIQLDPAQPRGWAHRAALHAQRQLWQAAIDDASLAISLAPHDPTAYHIRAQARYALGQIREAVQDYQTQQQLMTPPDAPNLQSASLSVAAA